jgi:hypothetical protein
MEGLTRPHAEQSTRIRVVSALKIASKTHLEMRWCPNLSRLLKFGALLLVHAIAFIAEGHVVDEPIVVETKRCVMDGLRVDIAVSKLAEDIEPTGAISKFLVKALYLPNNNYVAINMALRRNDLKLAKPQFGLGGWTLQPFLRPRIACTFLGLHGRCFSAINPRYIESKGLLRIERYDFIVSHTHPSSLFFSERVKCSSTLFVAGFEYFLGVISQSLIFDNHAFSSLPDFVGSIRHILHLVCLPFCLNSEIVGVGAPTDYFYERENTNQSQYYSESRNPPCSSSGTAGRSIACWFVGLAFFAFGFALIRQAHLITDEPSPQLSTRLFAWGIGGVAVGCLAFSVWLIIHAIIPSLQINTLVLRCADTVPRRLFPSGSAPR